MSYGGYRDTPRHILVAEVCWRSRRQAIDECVSVPAGHEQRIRTTAYSAATRGRGTPATRRRLRCLDALSAEDLPLGTERNIEARLICSKDGALAMPASPCL